MKTFLAAIPIFDAHLNIEAYYLRTGNSEKPLGLSVDYLSLDDMVRTVSLDVIEDVGVDPFAGDSPLFVDVNHLHLALGAPQNKNIPPKRLVCVLPRKTKLDQTLETQLKALKKAGYLLALEIDDDRLSRSSVLSIMDYVVIDVNKTTPDHARWILRPLSRLQKIVLMGIPDMDLFRRYSRLSQTYFAGSFYSQPLIRGTKNISPLKITTLQLINEANREDSDLIQISRTIERDPVLSISLLRFINSPAVGVRRHIDSIRSAVAILGQSELRRWVTVALSVQLGDDRPSEITRLSLLRAKFAENLAPLYERGVFMRSLFMAGLFSMVDVILQKPIEAALAEIHVDERVRDALINRKGQLYDVLEMVYLYERADWDGVTINLIRNSVKSEDAIGAFMDALLWYKQLLDELHT